MQDISPSPTSTRVWPVGALCRAIADALDARFNPVTVAGEISGFTRAASGHCYFTLKDASGQLRCAMFRRAAISLDFAPQDGELVEVLGRLGVYEPRGELQLVVERMRRAGQGNLFEQFVRLKAKLEAEGLFDAARKRELPLMPRGVGLVTSLGAAALHDVVSTFTRRVSHIPLLLAPASVQGAGAAAELIAALHSLYAQAQNPVAAVPPVDVILLVRGGGSMEDLWSFNDEALARVIAQSPVPVMVGVGHETDFTIADFVADVRAPTPTAAAELVAQPTALLLSLASGIQQRLVLAMQRMLERQSQRLDYAGACISRPSSLLQKQQLRLSTLEQALQHSLRTAWQSKQTACDRVQHDWTSRYQRAHERRHERLERMAQKLQMLDPALVLQRGYAWLTDAQGHAITSVNQTQLTQRLRAVLADGQLNLQVLDKGNN
jgi:exodeoxyribonuclease VII large subunit